MGGHGIRALTAGLALVLAACGSGAPERPAGDSPTFVSLNPCLDAILVDVAAPQQVLALSHYSRDPAASSMDVGRARHFGVTGGTAEEVIALHPDVVLASSLMDPATKSALERAGMRVETFGSPASVEESVAQVRELASLTGGSVAGEEVVAAMEARTWPPEPLETDLQSAPDPTVLLWQEGEIIPGEATLIAELLRDSGFASHAERLGLAQADRVSLEQLLADPPDLLLVAGASRGQNHPALAAVRGMRIEPFEPRLFYCGGPSIPAARADLAAIRKAFEDRAR